MEINRDAATVVDHGDRVVDMDGDVDLVAEAGQRFVDRVIDDFVDQVVKPGRAGRSDVHRGALANGFEPLENLDFVRTVIVDRGAVAVRARRGAGLCFVALAIVVRLVLLFGILHAYPCCQIRIGMIT
jgi:hypothetical protein